MPRLLLFDRRVMDRARHLIPPTGSPDPWRMTNESETLLHLVDALRADLLHTPAQGLRIIAHGNSGRLQFTFDGLHQGNVGTLSRLRGLIRGTVEIHGCAVASATRIELIRVQGIGNIFDERATPGSLDAPWSPNIGMTLAANRELTPEAGRLIRAGQGVQFLIAFANAIGLPTTGAVQAQQPDRNWSFEGPTLMAWPLSGLFLTIPPGDTTFGPKAPAGHYQVPT